MTPSRKPTSAPPRPPAQLWGLWVVTRRNPDGFWWQHVHGPRERGAAPMTFTDREDAEATRENEEPCLDDEDDTMVVALIGVAPTGSLREP